MGDFRKLIFREKPFVVAIQETKCNSVDIKWINHLWGSNEVEFLQKEKIGKSGGFLLLWDPKEFTSEQHYCSDFFIAIKGKWRGRDETSFIVNIYGPHDDSNKKKMWASLENFVGQNDGAWVLCGDFNEVRNESERQRCAFLDRRAKWFNDFIDNTHLIEVPLCGKKFTRICDNGIKFSKLDRFLISEKFNNMWGDVSVLALERLLSDHCPIVLRNKEIDFGPKPVKIFDEWLDEDGSKKVIKKAWAECITGQRHDCNFRIKLKKVKFALKEWSKEKFGQTDK
ncbi:uncharacterized protein [Rutidosis leptorrhynchoides]|uniref:uncharacterized protein n=1 Tax=Rutidosis leptorrhynchoides TaxID=125765 RepID=UPI003A9A2B0E